MLSDLLNSAVQCGQNVVFQLITVLNDVITGVQRSQHTNLLVQVSDLLLELLGLVAQGLIDALQDLAIRHSILREHVVLQARLALVAAELFCLTLDVVVAVAANADAALDDLFDHVVEPGLAERARQEGLDPVRSVKHSFVSLCWFESLAEEAF